MRANNDSCERVRRVMALIAKKKTKAKYEPASEADIRRVERMLGTRLPADLVTFYREMGWLDAPGDDVLGIGQGASAHTNALTARDGAMKWDGSMFPSSGMPILRIGNGDITFVDTADGRVYDWQHELNECSLEFPSFAKWFEHRAKMRKWI